MAGHDRPEPSVTIRQNHRSRWARIPSYYRSFVKSGEQNQLFKNKLTIPVLAMGGESGVGASIGMAMSKIATSVNSVVIPECGHYIPEERPKEFTDILLPFVSKN